ncbi:hypothetical protein [Rhizobium esperanzae]|uniref:Uncharacterized protein n=1 Tax=Rhizobium esperanzae TaxID=1967781 RepID=A0A7W6R2B8_9HYPH|nr:hypothetical protein [Rhizobium esperanzae]MBB4235546.1 hypothetical protein [Rhizobium esperanzae]
MAQEGHPARYRRIPLPRDCALRLRRQGLRGYDDARLSWPGRRIDRANIFFVKDGVIHAEPYRFTRSTISETLINHTMKDVYPTAVAAG